MHAAILVLIASEKLKNFVFYQGVVIEIKRYAKNKKIEKSCIHMAI